MSISCSINNGSSLEANLVAYDLRGGIVFISAFGYSTAIKAAEKAIKKKNTTFYVNYRNFGSEGDVYNVYTSKIAGSDFSHIIIMRKNISDPLNPNDDGILLYLFLDNVESMKNFKIYRNIHNNLPKEFLDELGRKLYDSTSIPIIEEWIPFIAEEMIKRGHLYEVEYYGLDRAVHDLHIVALRTTNPTLVNIISYGLKENLITINGNKTVSPFMSEMSGLDSYIGKHSEIFSNKIQEAFLPRFIPGKTEYSEAVNDYTDYVEYNSHLKFFDAQKAVIQSVNDALKNQKSAFIIGECGTGN